MQNDNFLNIFNKKWMRHYSVYENNPISPIKEEEEYLYSLLNEIDCRSLWLDLCSCTGRLISIAYNLGFKKLIAIDINYQCKEIILRKADTTRFICGDIRKMNWHKDKDIYNSSSIITMGCGTIQCFNNSEQEEIIKNAHSSLHENGKLVLSYWNDLSNFPLCHADELPTFNQNSLYSLHCLAEIYSLVEVTRTDYFTFISSTK